MKHEMARNDHSGYPMKWFKDENAARRAYECVICLEVVKDAVQVRDCGHQFCALCIDDILKADPRCPSCRIQISDAMVFADHAARRLIKQLEVNCCNEGCTWTGCLSSLLQGHQNNCNFLIQRNENNAQKVKVEELEKKHDTLMLKVLLFEQRHEQDITVLKLKYEQDIEGLKLKYEEDIKDLKLKHQRDMEDLQLKDMQEKQDSRELQLKHQQEKQDIMDLQLKHQQEQQDIRELQSKLEHEKQDIKDFKLKHEQDIRELKLKLQQAEDLWKRLKEKEKELCEEEKLQKTSLKKSKNRWQRPEEKEKDLSEEDKETAQLFREVLAILNKLTPKNLKSLVEQAVALNIDTPERLEGVIDLVYETAIRQPMFSVVYANMCRCLFTIKVADAEGEDVSFRKLLLNRCQKEFEKEKEDEQALLEKNQQLEGLSGCKRKAKENGIDEVLENNKKRMIGNIKFIGELFKLKLLTENIMHDCVYKLLRAGDEVSLESMCKLFCTTGKELDSEKAKFRVDQYFDQINKIIVSQKVSSRVMFMLRDVVELRDNQWIPRHEEHIPKTGGETYFKKVQEQSFSSQLPVKDKKPPAKDRQVQRNRPRLSDSDITTCTGGVSVPFYSRAKSFEQLGHGNFAGIDNSSEEQDELLRNLVHHSAGVNRPHAFMRTASTPSFAGLSESDERRMKGDADTEIAVQQMKAFCQEFKLFDGNDAIGEKNEGDKRGGAGKTAPVTRVRKYDREFLLQLRYKPICLQKPAGLPNHEIVLDRPFLAHKGAASQRGLPPPLFQKKTRFDIDVFCIVQDETSFSKFHVNLPRSTAILDLYRKAAEEFGYKQDTFLLVLKHTTAGQNDEVQEIELLNWTKILTLGDICQPPPQRKHRFYLRRRAMNVFGMHE